MATEPLNNEAIALTEKKVDMALDDIIKMTKGNVSKGKKQGRPPNKSQNFSNSAAKYNAVKAQRYMDSRSAVRQGAFAKRRSNFQGNQFPVTSSFAHKAATALPLRGRPINAGRMANTNQSRFVAPPVQSRAAHGGFMAKRQQQQQQQQLQQQRGRDIEQKQGNGGPRQRQQTLDSLFANMKEERMRRFPQQQQQQQLRRNVRSDAIGMQLRPMVPWARGRRWGN